MRGQEKWPISQTVKTSPSHGEDMGSIPVWVTRDSSSVSFLQDSYRVRYVGFPLILLSPLRDLLERMDLLNPLIKVLCAIVRGAFFVLCAIFARSAANAPKTFKKTIKISKKETKPIAKREKMVYNKCNYVADSVRRKF